MRITFTKKIEKKYYFLIDKQSKKKKDWVCWFCRLHPLINAVHWRDVCAVSYLFEVVLLERRCCFSWWVDTVMSGLLIRRKYPPILFIYTTP